MKILVIGQSAREHALAWKLAGSPLVERVFVAPGNSGTQREPRVENVPLHQTDDLIAFARQHGIAFTVVGSAGPLSAGIVDHFEACGLSIFGPTRGAAQLEWSKVFSKAFMRRHDIPTPRHWVFDDASTAKAFVRSTSLPLVIKADGLVKGFETTVTVAATLLEADAAIDELLSSRGGEILIEEFVRGRELSFTVISDGETVQALPSSRDYKRRLESDQGPNTGGMGAYSPAQLLDERLSQTIMATIVEPTLKGIAAEGHRYRGFLYVGVIVDEKGLAQALEFNCRLGDPEAQSLLLRMEGDLASLLDAGCKGALSSQRVSWRDEPSVAICVVTPEYPAEKRSRAIGAELPMPSKDCKIFHGSTSVVASTLRATGGRAFCVSALGATVGLARARAYDCLTAPCFEGLVFRRDIGLEVTQDGAAGHRRCLGDVAA